MHACLNLLLTEDHDPNKSVPVEKDILRIDDEFVPPFNTPNYNPSNENIKVEKLPYSSDKNFDTWYATNKNYAFEQRNIETFASVF